MPGPADGGAPWARLWASRWPEAIWAAFAVGNLAWMVLVPTWSMLPFHFTWVSLLLLYGLGYRTASRTLTWWLLVPVIAGAALLFIDDRIRALAPYDELVELPVMALLLFAITGLTNRRKAAMAALDEVSRRNTALLERQRVFIQNASHELRTPITIALAHAELLPGSVNGAAEDAAIVADELGRLRRLVDRLLQLAAAEQPASFSLVPVPVAGLVGEVMRRWEPVPRRWLAGPLDQVTVLADRDRLLVALDAILDNAVRFTAEGDAIEVSVRRCGADVTISIADSGPGIPEDQLESVFDGFAAPDPRRDRAHHFGLGLPIVRAVAEGHGGHVTATRAMLGGAALTVWLPLHQPAASDHAVLPGDHVTVGLT